MTANFYDVCRRINLSETFTENLFVAAAAVGGAPDFYFLDAEVFGLGDTIGRGASGLVRAGTFNLSASSAPARRIAVKVNRKGTLETDLDELRAHGEAFCAYRARAFVSRHAAGIARIPKPLFAATIQTTGGEHARVLGMEQLDESLILHLKKARRDDEARATLRACALLRSLFGLLDFLQRDAIQLMHGDLHGNNVMVRQPSDPSRLPEVFLIDFGMSSYVPSGRTSRHYVHRRYAGTRFNPHTDPLMLLTHLSEWAVRNKWTALALITLEPIEPFWTGVAAAEREPGRPPPTAVGQYIRKKGADFFTHSHHALYQRTEDVSVPTAAPRALVAHFSGDPAQRQAAASPEAMARVRALLRPLLLA